MDNDKTDDLFIVYEEIYYYVNLVNGEVTAAFDYLEMKGPYKKCENMVEADFYSLNILRQNANEQTYKVGSKPEQMSRTFLDIRHNVLTKNIEKMMKYLEEKYPEYFL